MREALIRRVFGDRRTMLLIAHRGNIQGPDPKKENSPDYIDAAIEHGVNVEVDIRYINGKFWLGHDEPQYEVSLEWLSKRVYKMWIHAKNLAALNWFLKDLNSWNVFWHQEDDYTITSLGYIWAYPGSELSDKSVCVMPESVGEDYDPGTNILGICTDFVEKYKV